MCFSATASFVAGAGLFAVGIGTLRIAARKTDIPLASVPLLFGLQQLTEGMIWLSFEPGSQLSNPTLTFLYSLFSHVLWPILIPFAVLQLEHVAWRKRAITACCAAGTAVGLYLLYMLVQFGVTSRVLGKHIAYESPHFYVVSVMVLYLIGTCVSPLLSSSGTIQLFGGLALATFLAALAIHVATFFSVWCFFAAVLSVIIFYHVRRRRGLEPA